MISHLGSLISVVAGALLARRFKGDTSAIGATTIGDGGTSTGAFHEAINMAAVEKLPLVVVVVNNQYAYSTPNSRQFACKDLVDRADRLRRRRAFPGWNRSPGLPGSARACDGASPIWTWPAIGRRKLPSAHRPRRT